MRAKIKDLIVGMDAGYVTLSIPQEEINRLVEMEGKELDATIKIHRESRSKDANAMMWACIGQIANALNTDKWEIYLKMLKRYGQFTHMCVKPIAVDAIKRQWRECEIVGEVEINGKKAVQMLCYYGSSTYVCGGVIEGDILAPEGVHLYPKAVVLGDIVTKHLQLDGNVLVNGECITLSDEEAFEEAKNHWIDVKAVSGKTFIVHEN